jgi:beta-glucosidase
MKNTGRPYDPNNGYTSRYLDIPNSPLYPFGYGLSYTKFQFSQPKVNTTVWRMGQTLEVNSTVTNSGDRDGATVAQLYVRDLVGMSGRPVRELKGFERVYLRKGESKTVVFRLNAADVAYTHPDGTFGADPGAFELFVGEDANAGNTVKVDLTH